MSKVASSIKQRYKMMVLTASNARANLHELLRTVAKTHTPVLIMGKDANAVILSQEDWGTIQETLCLLSTSGVRKSICAAREDIKAGRTKPMGQVFGK